jgi:uncharacterized membrane protein YccC
MFIPLIIGYLTGQLQIGLLMATGTLAHIYVFGGSARSKLRIVLYTTIGLSIAMILGVSDSYTTANVWVCYCLS